MLITVQEPERVDRKVLCVRCFQGSSSIRWLSTYIDLYLGKKFLACIKFAKSICIKHVKCVQSSSPHTCKPAHLKMAGCCLFLFSTCLELHQHLCGVFFFFCIFYKYFYIPHQLTKNMPTVGSKKGFSQSGGKIVNHNRSMKAGKRKFILGHTCTWYKLWTLLWQKALRQTGSELGWFKRSWKQTLK